MSKSWKLPVQDLLSAPWSSGVLVVTSTMVPHSTRKPHALFPVAFISYPHILHISYLTALILSMSCVPV